MKLQKMLRDETLQQVMENKDAGAVDAQSSSAAGTRSAANMPEEEEKVPNSSIN